MASANFYPSDNMQYITLTGDIENCYNPQQPSRDIREIGTNGPIDHAGQPYSQTATPTNILIKINGQPVGAIQKFDVECKQGWMESQSIKLSLSRIRYDRQTLLDVIGAKEFYDAWNHPFEITIEDNNTGTITTFGGCRMTD